MIKIGLIGVGIMGSVHNACFVALSGMTDVKVTAIADASAERLAEAAKMWPDAETYSSGMELLEKAHINTADICLPTYLHAEHAIVAMEKGYHVFLEKPVCLKADDMEELLKVEEKTGAKVMVGQVLRMSDEYIYLKELYDSKKYGKMRSIVMNRLSPKPKWGWENWFHQIDKSGSIVVDLHIHDADFIRYLIGEPKAFYSAAVKNKDGIPEQVTTTYFYDDCVAIAEGGWDYPDGFAFNVGYRACFETATVVFNNLFSPSLVVYPVDASSFEPALKKEFESEDTTLIGNITSLGAYFTELKYFVEHLIEDKPLTVAPLSEGIESVKLVLKELEFVMDSKGE